MDIKSSQERRTAEKEIQHKSMADGVWRQLPVGYFTGSIILLQKRILVIYLRAYITHTHTKYGFSKTEVK